MKLKPEIKRRWVEALRSGSYKQGKSVLTVESCHGQRFCCLGVLCDLAENDKIGRWVGDTFVGADDLRSSSYLPLAVANWAFDVNSADSDEMEDGDIFLDRISDPRVDVGTYEDGTRQTRTLSSLNDSGNYDFRGIAELIEAKL